MYKFTEEEKKEALGWFYATVNSKTQKYYNINYTETIQLSDDLAGSIISNYFFYIPGAVEKGMRLLSMNMGVYHALTNRKTFTYSEIVWFAWKTWAFHTTRSELTEIFGENWERIMQLVKLEMDLERE